MIVNFSDEQKYINLDNCLTWQFEFNNPPAFIYRAPGEKELTILSLSPFLDPEHWEELHETIYKGFRTVVGAFETALQNDDKYFEFCS